MKLSVIIVSWNTRELLGRCLQSLKRQETEFQWETIVIDNDSRDGSSGMVEAEHPWVHLIASTRNLGFARANNLGFRQAKGEYLLLLNPDTEVQPGALKHMVRYMDCQREVGILGCRLLNPDLSLQPSCREFPDSWVYAYMSLKLQHVFPQYSKYQRYLMTDWAHDTPRSVDQISGACMMMRRVLSETVGELDEGFWIWFEEVDYCRRAKNQGIEVHFTPGAEVVHYGGQSFNQVNTYRRQLVFNRSMLRYFRKHDTVTTHFALWAIHPLSLSLAGVIHLYRRIFKRPERVKFYDTLTRSTRSPGGDSH